VEGIEDRPGEPLVVHVEQAGARPWCHRCGGPSRVKDRDPVTLADLPCFGRPVRLVWDKFRLCCPDGDCEMGRTLVIYLALVVLANLWFERRSPPTQDNV